MRDIQWEDTGYDCEHCGGEVLKRTDNKVDDSYYQCSQCGYRWTMDGKVIRKGSNQSPYWEEKEAGFHPATKSPSRQMWWLVSAFVGLTAVFFLGSRVLLLLLWAVRLLPLFIVTGIFYFIWRYGQTEEWW